MFIFSSSPHFRRLFSKTKAVHDRFVRSLSPILFFLSNRNGARLGYLFIVIILVSLLKGIIPVIFKYTIDDFVSESLPAHTFLADHFVIFLCCFCALYLLEPLKRFISQKLLVSSESNLLSSFVQGISRVSYSFLMKSKLGVISHFLEKAISSLKMISEGLLLQLIPNILDLLIIFLMISLNLGGKYSFTYFAFLTIYVASTYILQKGFLKPLSNVQMARSSLMSGISDYVQGQETLRSFRKNTSEGDYNKTKIWGREQTEIKLVERSSRLLFCQNVIFLSAFLCLFILAYIDVKKGNITIGDFVMIQTYLFNLFAPIKYIGVLIEDIIKCSIDFMNIEPFVEKETVSKDTKSETRSALNSLASFFPITCENLSFNIGHTKILKNLNFTIQKNKTTAIIGKNGSGKSTLLKLLLGVLTPSSGQVLLGSHSLNTPNFPPANFFSVVPQDLYLFTDTIQNNICFSRQDCDTGRLIEVCKMLDIHDWVSQLPQKYNTRIGESELKLSGGEKQLIAIARALYAPSQVLILDEATSNLDSDKEEFLLSNIQQYFEGTIVLVSHRDSIIKQASNIIMLDNGVITEPVWMKRMTI